MLESLTASAFAACQGDVFTVTIDSKETTELLLIEVKEIGGEESQAREGRTPFSLLFRGPLDVALEQRIYHFENDRIDACDIFIVPVGSDAEGMQYEAIFN